MAEGFKIKKNLLPKIHSQYEDSDAFIDIEDIAQDAYAEAAGYNTKKLEHGKPSYRYYLGDLFIETPFTQSGQRLNIALNGCRAHLCNVNNKETTKTDDVEQQGYVQFFGNATSSDLREGTITIGEDYIIIKCKVHDTEIGLDEANNYITKTITKNFFDGQEKPHFINVALLGGGGASGYVRFGLGSDNYYSGGGGGGGFCIVTINLDKVKEQSKDSTLYFSIGAAGRATAESSYKAIGGGDTKIFYKDEHGTTTDLAFAEGGRASNTVWASGTEETIKNYSAESSTGGIGGSFKITTSDITKPCCRVNGIVIEGLSGGAGATHHDDNISVNSPKWISQQFSNTMKSSSFEAADKNSFKNGAANDKKCRGGGATIFSDGYAAQSGSKNGYPNTATSDGLGIGASGARGSFLNDGEGGNGSSGRIIIWW